MSAGRGRVGKKSHDRTRARYPPARTRARRGIRARDLTRRCGCGTLAPLPPILPRPAVHPGNVAVLYPTEFDDEPAHDCDDQGVTAPVRYPRRFVTSCPRTTRSETP